MKSMPEIFLLYLKGANACLAKMLDIIKHMYTLFNKGERAPSSDPTFWA